MKPSMVQKMALLAPSHYLNQCWLIVKSKIRDQMQWNLNKNATILIQENQFEQKLLVN